MKKKILMSFALAALVSTSAWGQTDVTATYLVNPSFEYSAEGVAYTATTELTNGGTIYGWNLPTISDSNKNIQVKKSEDSENHAFGATATSDGDYFFYIRQGWEDKTSSLSQTANLPVGKYFISAKYKMAEGHDDGTFRDSKLGFTITQNSEELAKLSTGGSVNAPGSSYFTDVDWKHIGTWFTVSTEGEVKIEVTMSLNGSSKRADLCIDNVRLYKWDLDDATNFANATTSAPLDVTAKYVTNPYFDSNVTGWTSTTGYQNSARATNQYGAFSGGFFENWNGSAKTSGEMYQELTGLEDGIYRLTAAVSANNASANVKLFIGEYQSENINTSTPAFYTVQGNISGGTAKIGLVLGDGNEANWIGLDNIRLEYLGYDLTEALNALTSLHDSCKDYDVTKPMATSYATAFTNALTAAKNVIDGTTAQTQANITTASQDLTTAYDNVVKSVANYAAIAEKYNGLDADGKAAFLATTTGAKYDGKTLTDEDWTEDYYTAIRAQGIGATFTDLLANPHFKTNELTGWDLNGKASPTIDVTNHDCEFFEKTFDLSQTVTNLKKGTYEITVQAFQRPGAASAALVDNYLSDNWTSCATLYSTAQESDVKHICAEMREAAVYGTSGNWPDDSQVTPTGGTLKYIPNSTVGGRTWFDTEGIDGLLYTTKVSAVVTENGGSLSFGFKGELATGCWLLFDNFTLKYVSTDVLVDAAESEKLIGTAEELESDHMQGSVKTDLTNAKNALSADKTNGTLYNNLQNAIAYANASIAAYARLKALIDKYSTLTAATEAKSKYDEASTSTAEIKAYCVTFQRAAFCESVSTPYAGATAAAGTFYLYNVEAGKFMQGGNTWGTQVSLSHSGQPMILAASGDNYTIDSQIKNNDKKHYVGQGQYLDAESAVFTLTDIGDHFYTINWNDGANMYGYDGENTLCAIQTEETAGSYWQLVTADVIKTAMGNATETSPLEVTSLILDSDFGRNNTLSSNWTVSSDCTNKNLSGGNNINNCAESFHSIFTISQVLSDMPNGLYKMTAQGFYRQDGSDNDNLPKFFANDAETTFPLKTGEEGDMAAASVSFTAGQYTI